MGEEEVEDMEEEEVEDMEEVTVEEEAIVVTEMGDMEEAMVVATIMTDTMVVVTIQKEVREVEDTIPREAAEALLIKNWVIAVIGTSILAIARKNANECGNIVVVLFHTSFVKEASFLNRMNYLHGKSIHAQLQCSSVRFLWGDITKSVFLGNSGERVLHYIYLFQFT